MELNDALPSLIHNVSTISTRILMSRREDLFYTDILSRTHAELDLTRQDSVEAFFKEEKPEYVFLAAAKVGGIWGNNMYPAEYIYNNLTIQNKKAHAGEITNMTGISAPYEEPEHSDLIIETDKLGLQQCVDEVIRFLLKQGLIMKAEFIGLKTK